MKKTIVIITATMLLLSLVSAASAELYPTTAMVCRVDRESDLVYCKECNGNIWAFFGVEDWEEGDLVSMIMDDNDTELIYDDMILQVRYGGYVEGF